MTRGLLDVDFDKVVDAREYGLLTERLRQGTGGREDFRWMLVGRML